MIPGTFASGALVELDPPHRLVPTWGWEAKSDGETYDVPPASSTVEFVLEPDGEGTRGSRWPIAAYPPRSRSSTMGTDGTASSRGS